MQGGTERLDNFTDAAFAFALSLLVIGSDVPASLAELKAAVADIPAFAIGFATIAMFWSAHVRWRAMRGAGGPVSVLVTLALVFIVLTYIRPLQGMALSFSAFMGGSGRGFAGDIGGLFAIYGAGFAAMSAAVAALFLDAAHAGTSQRRAARGEAMIWGLLALTGLVSMLMALTRSLAMAAPWAYATLPLTVGLAAYLYTWAEPDEA